MTPRQFSIWLKAFTNALGGRKPTSDEWDFARAGLVEAFGALPSDTAALFDAARLASEEAAA